MRRVELQDIIDTALAGVYQANSIKLHFDHKRRLARVLLRCAARLAMSCGCPPLAFAGMALQCYMEETPREPEQALTGPFSPKVKVGIS